MKAVSCKLLVIGGGPGGYIAGIRAGQLGIDTVLIEGDRLGGTCLNVGCIPSKAIIHASEAFHALVSPSLNAAIGITANAPSIDFAKTVSWKNGIVGRLNSGVGALLKKNKVKVFSGRAHIVDGKTCVVTTGEVETRITCDHLVIATGSEPVEIKALPFGGKIISSTGALDLPAVPESLVVVGAGYIGLELGTAFAKLGSKVTVVEAAERILPAYDAELTRPVAKRLEHLGITLMTGVAADGMTPDETALAVAHADGRKSEVAADKVLVAVGRRARIAGFGLETLGLSMNGNVIAINERAQTSMRNVWAVGDVTGEPMLAHRAMAQGEMVAEIIAGHIRSFDKACIPAVCFTDPEIVSAGLSPDEARKAGFDIVTGQFPFAANGRAMTRQGEDGFVRITARSDNHVVLGVQAVGQGISELSAAFGLAIEMGARLEDIAATVHSHPTQGEGFQESAMKALGHALHI
jgi:dihydrolipoamide dehydrogenase